jgi:hypothetical protein
MIRNPEILKKYLSDVFIETGTSYGDGVQMALDCGFRSIYSMEVMPDRFGASCRRFEGRPEVKLYLGDSLDVLPALLSELQGTATFWLDAHVNSSKDTIHGRIKCPVLPELDLVLACPIKKTILIDDMRLFRGNGRKL